jgi:hypothetical protein
VNIQVILLSAIMLFHRLKQMELPVMILQCPGQTICFTVYTSDADSNLFLLSLIIQFRVVPPVQWLKTEYFCWHLISMTNLLPNSFTVTVRDNSCPSNGIGLSPTAFCACTLFYHKHPKQPVFREWWITFKPCHVNLYSYSWIQHLFRTLQRPSDFLGTYTDC